MIIGILCIFSLYQIFSRHTLVLCLPLCPISIMDVGYVEFALFAMRNQSEDLFDAEMNRVSSI